MNIYHRGSKFSLTLQFEGAERLHRMEAIFRLKTNGAPAKGRILEALNYKDKTITGTLNNKGEILESAKESGKVRISFQVGPRQTYGEYKLERVYVEPIGRSSRNLHLGDKDIWVRIDKSLYEEVPEVEVFEVTDIEITE